MRILICGSRGWIDPEPIKALILERIAEAGVRREDFSVMHGDARKGADALADQICLDLGMVPGVDLIRVPADWDRYGKSAGPIRNQEMLDRHPDEVHAFRYGAKSNGTDDMVRRAKKAGVPTRVYTRNANYA